MKNRLYSIFLLILLCSCVDKTKPETLKDRIQGSWVAINAEEVRASGFPGKYRVPFGLNFKKDSIDFGDFNDEYRMPFFNKYDEYENMFIDMALLDGSTTLVKIRAAYDLPMYGYKRHGEFYFLKPQLGAKAEPVSAPAMPSMEMEGEASVNKAAQSTLRRPEQGYNN